MSTLEEKLKALSPDARARVDARADQLRAEIDTHDELRRLYAKAHDNTARAQNLTPAQLAKAVKDSDELVAALRKYVETMGGSLKIVAEFPDKAPVEIDSLLDLAESSDKN